ncbi:hypothetical protein AcV7_002350 [Taiwanofungus camphoratus]|nr:hypothetical protein AcV7_002350 [Antrodia cinnamomea]
MAVSMSSSAASSTSAPSSTLPIACRLVSTDQWLVTHLDCSWTIARVKQCLLDKFFSSPRSAHQSPPHKHRSGRRDRPLSPITFSTYGHSDDDVESPSTARDDDEDDFDAFDGFSDDVDYCKFKYSPAARPADSATTLVAGPSSAPPAITLPSQSKSRARAEVCTPARYTLLSFATGQLLEDHFALAWYAFRPYELLELHSHAGPGADGLINLPRVLPEAYVRPYFEARVRVLRVVGSHHPAEYLSSLPKRKGKEKVKDWQKQRDLEVTPISGPVMEEGPERDVDTSTGERKEKKRRKKMEWHERWVVIHQGMFKLGRHRNDLQPLYTAPLSALLALGGPDHLQLRKPVPSPLTKTNVLPVASTSPTSTPMSSPTIPTSHLGPSHSDTAKSAHFSNNVCTDADDRKTICAKFRAGPHPPPYSPMHPNSPPVTSESRPRTSMSTATDESRPSTSDGGAWWRRGSKDAGLANDLSGVRRGSGAGLEAEDPGGGNSQDRVREGDTEDAVWIIMDMLGDAAYHNILRVLHRHAPHTCNSSFLPNYRSRSTSSSVDTFLATSPSNPQPELGYTFPPPESQNHGSPTLSSSLSFTSAPSSSATLQDWRTMHKGRPRRSENAVPYPEWRLAVLRRARRAGLGHVGHAMELAIFREDGSDTEEYMGEVSEEEASFEDEESVVDGEGLERRSVDKCTEEPPQSPQHGRQDSDDISLLWGDPLAEDSENGSDGENGSTSDASAREWEGWVDDLPRQRRVQERAEERRLQQLEYGARIMAEAEDTEARWAPGWLTAWGGMSAADDANCDSECEGSSSPRSLNLDWGSRAREDSDQSPHPHVLTSYASADSLLSRTLRSMPSRFRPKLHDSGRGLTSASLLPLTYQERDRERMPSDSGSVSSSGSHALYPARGPIPMSMAMTRMRTSTVTVGHDKHEKRDTSTLSGEDLAGPQLITRNIKGKSKASRKNCATEDNNNGTRADASTRNRSSLLHPAKLKLSLPLTNLASAGETPATPSLSAPSPNSLESIRFVTPSSESGESV